MRWPAVAKILLLALFLFSAPAQAGDPAGRWALRVGGRTLILLELERAPGGAWSGRLLRPQHMHASQFLIFSGVEGPVVTRTVKGTEQPGGTIRLAATGSTPDDTDAYLFRVLEAGTGELALADVPPGIHFPAMTLARARAGEAVAESWDPYQSYAIDIDRPSNPEMKAMFDADQAARSDPTKIDWRVLGPQDEARRLRTLQLLQSGALNSGADFYHAAFIFQHGGKPDDYLLAHTLAVAAVTRGRPDGAWIAAATLDRYLQNIGQKQIYGTQFTTPPGGRTTQDPYDPKLIPDSLREALGVPPLADQERQRAEFEAQERAMGAAPASRRSASPKPVSRRARSEH